MAMHRPRLVTLVALGLGMTAALPNVRYPPLSKMPTSKLKKQGKCYQVTHTFETAFGLDKLPRLDPEATESNLLVDRFDGSLVSDACRSTQVLLSLPTDDTDMGSFKKTTGWAAQAIQLVAGSIVVDYAMLDANLAREYRRAEARRKKWTNKRNNTTSISPVREAMFMMYFECPSAPSEKGRKPREYSVAMTHIDQATVMLALSPYMAFAQLARNAKGTDPLNDQGFWQLASDQRLPAGHSDDGTGWVGETATSISVHDPLCPRIRVAGYSGFCYMFKRIQLWLYDKFNSDCKYDYPQSVQPKINQSQNLGFDNQGRVLPGPFADLLPLGGGRLPYEVPPAAQEDEKATLWWLRDKTTQLALYAPCSGGGSVPFASLNQMAPGFTQDIALYYVNEYNETLPSNFTLTPLAWSANGLDRNNNKTTVIAVRGTNSRSELMADFTYEQRTVSAADDPIMAPFIGVKIHTGYSLYVQQILAQIKSNITAYSPERIIVTGHSLGGGVATLLSYALAKEIRDGKLLTPSVRVDAALFAPPTVGDQAFANEFNALVNARRVAFAPTRNRYWPHWLSTGDPVAQSLCPTMPTCFYDDPHVVSQKPPPARPATYINYASVDGNIFFSARNMPTAMYTGVPPDAIRENYRENDRLVGGNLDWAHECSYTCYTSTAVDAPLNSCFGAKNAKASYGGAIPEHVRRFGLCPGS